jgi:hypothetical protein
MRSGARCTPRVKTNGRFISL